MSKRQHRAQASSSRATSGTNGPAFGASSKLLGSAFLAESSSLSFIREPPDFSGISDANLIVILKNLSKRDSTTRARALEELQSYVGSQTDEVEDAVLEAWVGYH